jgi:hypothetical protein
MMVERVEIVIMNDPSSKKILQYNPMAEKWVDLDGSNQIYLHLIYGQSRPITDINFYKIKHQKG